MTITRRQLLGGGLGTLALLGAAPLVRAGGSGPGRRFLFINAEGGWDPLCVFAPKFGASDIDMEPQAEPWSVGGLDLVDHPARPVTRSFFEQRGSEVALLHGVSTRSVNHETCQVVALTGATSEDFPDWGTLLGYAQREERSLPHLVVSGPAFAGPHSVIVSNARGLLQPTIDGTLLYIADRNVEPPSAPASRVVDHFLEARGRARAQVDPEAKRLADYREALTRSRSLRDSALELDLVGGGGFADGLDTAVAALSAGVCRCASVGTDFVWDTHEDNTQQSGLFEGFFADLERLLANLETTPGPDGQPLANDTVVVVTSEMARTPAFNGTGGRDHWPFTSMMLLGPGLNTGRSYGAYTDLYTGVGVDAGGDPDASIAGISPDSLGATLLTLGDLDPAEHLRSGAGPIPGILS